MILASCFEVCVRILQDVRFLQDLVTRFLQDRARSSNLVTRFCKNLTRHLLRILITILVKKLKILDKILIRFPPGITF